MNNVALSRINQQILDARRISTKVNLIKEASPLCHPLSPDDLRSLLLKELQDDVKTDVKTDRREFSGLEDFVSWCFPLKDKFNERQQQAVSTLFQVRQMVDQGCRCRRKGRLQKAEEYFKIFWEKNAVTDLPTTVMILGNFKSISFAVGGVKFIEFHPTL